MYQAVFGSESMMFDAVIQNLQREAENLVGQENEEVSISIEPFFLRRLD